MPWSGQAQPQAARRPPKELTPHGADRVTGAAWKEEAPEPSPERSTVHSTSAPLARTVTGWLPWPRHCLQTQWHQERGAVLQLGGNACPEGPTGRSSDHSPGRSGPGRALPSPTHTAEGEEEVRWPGVDALPQPHSLENSAVVGFPRGSAHARPPLPLPGCPARGRAVSVLRESGHLVAVKKCTLLTFPSTPDPLVSSSRLVPSFMMARFTRPCGWAVGAQAFGGT